MNKWMIWGYPVVFMENPIKMDDLGFIIWKTLLKWMICWVLPRFLVQHSNGPGPDRCVKTRPIKVLVKGNSRDPQ